MKSKLVETVKQDPSVPIKRVYNTVVRCHQQGGGDVESIPRFSNIRSAMTRATQEFVPNIPHSVDDVVIEETWGETWSGDDYLLHHDNDWGILIFATTEIFGVCINAQMCVWTEHSALALHPMHSSLQYMVNIGIELSSLLNAYWPI